MESKRAGEEDDSLMSAGTGGSPWEPYRPYLAAFAKGAEASKAVTPGDAEKMTGKMIGGGFSWMTFIVGPLYWAYRRCYAESALYLLLVAALMDVWLAFGLRVGAATTNLVAGFLFYPLYRRRAMRVYRKAYEDCGGSEERIMEAMRSAGGVSWGAFMVMFACAAALCVAGFLLAMGPLRGL